MYGSAVRQSIVQMRPANMAGIFFVYAGFVGVIVGTFVTLLVLVVGFLALMEAIKAILHARRERIYAATVAEAEAQAAKAAEEEEAAQKAKLAAQDIEQAINENDGAGTATEQEQKDNQVLAHLFLNRFYFGG